MSRSCRFSSPERAALVFGQATPYAESLRVGQRVLKAFSPNLTPATDGLGLAAGLAKLREKGLWIGLCAQGTVHPAQTGYVKDDLEETLRSGDHDALASCAGTFAAVHWRANAAMSMAAPARMAARASPTNAAEMRIAGGGLKEPKR